MATVASGEAVLQHCDRRRGGRQPALAEKLRQATPHWTRHTHATHLLEGGAELTTVRDNLRHASLATTSIYLHADDARRVKQVADRFAVPRS